MLFDIKRVEFHSLKEFFKEYLMIVTGILTALALEHVVVAHTHAVAAEQSKQRIVEEIRTNLAETRAAFESNKVTQKRIADIQSKLKKDLLAGQPKQKIYSQLLEDMKASHGFSIGFNWPTLRHESWDVAVANQSASYIEPELLRRYSAAYSAREAAAATTQYSNLLQSSHGFDAVIDLELQRGDPVDFLKMLASVSGSLYSAQGNIAELQAQLEAALAVETPKSPQH